jgi:hypothetical protein
VLNINNTGGRARNTFLVLDLDQLDLAELRFLEGQGYVREIVGNQVVIGIGQNNTLNTERISLNLRFRVRIRVQVEQTVTITYRLRYSDSNGTSETDSVVLPVVVPPSNTTPTATPVASQTPGPSPTGGTPTPSPTASTPTPSPTAGPGQSIIIIPRLSTDDIDIRFRLRWLRGNSLRIYGYPLTRAVVLRSGIVVQYFERARFEYHPLFAGTENEVLLGLLGVELGFARPPSAPPSDDDDRAWYFPATGHLIAPAFRTTWRDEGDLRTYGYPIGPAFVDARGLEVQYFERARLELHAGPGGQRNLVLLGLLGEESLIARGGQVDDDDDD